MRHRYPLYRALIGFTCQAPIYVLFYRAQGMDYRSILGLTSAFALSKLICDIPSGIFADRFGRKPALFGRILLEALSVLLLLEGHFFLSALLAGAGCAFSTGAEQALVYEQCGPDFARVYGRGTSWGFLSTALASLAGAALAGIGFEWVYRLRLLTLGLAGSVLLTFPESRPQGATPVPDRSVRPAALPLLTLLGLVAGLHLSLLPLQQPYLVQAGFPIATLGLVFVALQLVTALGSRLSQQLPAPLFWVVLLSFAGFLALSPAPGLPGLGALLLLKLAHGISIPAAATALNACAPAHARATVLSLRSLFEGAALAVAAPLLGWTADGSGPGSAFLLAALLLLPSLFLFRRKPCVFSQPLQSPA